MNLQKLYENADYKDNMGMLFNDDCMNLMSNILSERERESKIIM